MLNAYYQDGNRLVATQELTDPAGRRPVWIDLLSPTTDEDHAVEQLLGISVPSHAEMQEIEVSSRLYSEGGANFMTITNVTRLDTNEPVKTPLTFILKNGTLVTVRFIDPRSFQIYSAQCQRPNGTASQDGEYVMLGLIETIVDRTADALEQIAAAVDGISHDVFRNRAEAESKARDLQGVIEHIGRQGDALSMIQEGLVTIRRAVAYHNATTSEADKRPRETRQRIRLIERDTASLAEHAGSMSNKISFLLDATLGLINLEQNQIIKIFSVAAVVLLPPTLVASVYGMNFHYMPELSLPFGYPMALGMMVLAAVLPYLYFKRRKWL